MKKSILLLLILIISLPILSACGASVSHSQVKAEMINFLTHENTLDVFNGTINYNAKVDAEKSNATSPFHTLVYYESLLSATLTPMQNFNGSFSYSPSQNSGSEGALCGALFVSLQNFLVDLENFENKKATFTNNTSRMSDINSVGALNELRNFEKEFGKILVKANNLQKTFMDTYSTLYGGVVRDGDISSNNVKNAVGKVYSDLVDAYLTYAVLEYNFYMPNAENNFNTKLLQLKTRFEDSPCISTNYSSWLEMYDLFSNELQMFYTALNNVDLTANNTSASGITKTYLEKIDNFVDINVGLFIDKTISKLF